MFRAVIGGRRLKMAYWTASRNETPSRLFDPDAHSFVNDGWDAFGYCHRSKKVPDRRGPTSSFGGRDGRSLDVAS
jgi:hypothetical protein